MNTDNGTLGKAAGLTAAVGVGAGLMFLLDPNRGRARRARLKDQTTHVIRACRDRLDKSRQDAQNRMHGLQSSMNCPSCAGSAPVSDQKLEARVRAKLGRVASRVHAIRVSAMSGVVLLVGEAPAGEVDRIVKVAAETPGVMQVDNRIAAREDARAKGRAGILAIPALLGLGSGLLAGFQALRSR